MKLSNEEVKNVSAFLAKILTDKSLVSGSIKTEDLQSDIYGVIYDDMQAEERLIEEVKTIMERYENELKNGKLDYNKLFNMIKQQLIKERKLVL